MLTNDFMLFPEKCALKVDADFMRPPLLMVWGGRRGMKAPIIILYIFKMTLQPF